MSHTEFQSQAAVETAVFYTSIESSRLPTGNGDGDAGCNTGLSTDPALAAAIDRLLQERLIARFVHRGQYGLNNLDVTVRDRGVTLRGVVSSYFERQLAIHLAESLPGVDAVLADIEIVPERNTYHSDRSNNYTGVARRTVSWMNGPTQFLSLLAIIAGLSTVSGCGGPSRLPLQQVSARVTLNGQPISGGTVVLHSTSDKFPAGLSPVGYVAADGTVQFTTYERGDGVPAGEYKATVTWRPFITVDDETISGDNQLPAIYASLESTTARVTVPSSGGEQPLIALAGSTENIAALPGHAGWESQ